MHKLHKLSGTDGTYYATDGVYIYMLKADILHNTYWQIIHKEYIESAFKDVLLANGEEVKSG